MEYKDNALISSIYEAAMNPGGWQGVIADLASRFNCHVGSMMCHGEPGQQHAINVRYSVFSNPEEIDRNWIENFSESDPWLHNSFKYYKNYFYNCRRLGTFTGLDCTPYSELTNSECYNEIYVDLNMDDWVGSVLRLSADEMSIVVVNRSKDAGFFSPEEKNQFEYFATHIRKSIRLSEELALSRISGEINADLSGTGIILMSSSGKILSVNPGAEKLIRISSLISIRNNKLNFREAGDQTKLQKLAYGISCGLIAAPGIMVLRGMSLDRNLALQLFPVRNVPAIFSLLGTTEPVLLLLVSGKSVSNAVSVQHALVQLGLTKAEARVCAELSMGRSARNIAELHEVAESTVRSQIKSSLLKLNFERQVDLIIFIKDLLPRP